MRLRVFLWEPWEKTLQLDRHLGDGLEDPVAVAALLEMMVEVPIHQLPEGLGREPPHFLPADDGVGPAGGRDIHQNGGGSLALGKLPCLEEDAGASLWILDRLLVDGESDPCPRVSPRLGKGGRNLLALGDRQKVP